MPLCGVVSGGFYESLLLLPPFKRPFFHYAAPLTLIRLSTHRKCQSKKELGEITWLGDGGGSGNFCQEASSVTTHRRSGQGSSLQFGKKMPKANEIWANLPHLSFFFFQVLPVPAVLFLWHTFPAEDTWATVRCSRQIISAWSEHSIPNWNDRATWPQMAISQMEL